MWYTGLVNASAGLGARDPVTQLANFVNCNFYYCDNIGKRQFQYWQNGIINIPTCIIAL
jgi:hypothetical protein